MYYELIFEDGSHSVACYDSDEEAVSAAEAHHARAMEGGRSLESEPNSPPAIRVAKMLKYEDHPQDLTQSQALPVGEVKKSFDAALKELSQGDLVSIPELTAVVRDMTNPMVVSGAHESNYKAEELEELKGAWA